MHLFGIYKQVYVFCKFLWQDENVPIFLCAWHILKNWKKKRQFRKSMTFLYRILFSMNVECGCTHNWDIKKTNNFFSIGSSLPQKNAWERGGYVLQNFESYFSSHYFPIISILYSLYSY